MALDLMDENEFFVDDLNVTFENIMNIVSGRISAKRLQKIINHLDYTEVSDDEPDENDDIDDFISIQVFYIFSV